MSNEDVWGCRHCGDVYEGSNAQGMNDKCPHCGLQQSKTYAEQVNKTSGQSDPTRNNPRS